MHQDPHRATPHQRFRTRRGFTLVELAVALAIAGLLAAITLKAVQSGVSNADCYTTTKLQVSMIDSAIERYVTANDKYPLPALRNAGVENIAYGREAALADLTTTATAPNVTYGALPFQTLGLAPSYASDCWGNKFTYAVTTDLIDAEKYNSTDPIYDGAITIRTDATHDLPLNAAYAIISHGADAVGAVQNNYSAPTSAAAAKWCTSSTTQLEHQNCDAASNALMAAQFNNGKDAGDLFFDDIISYKAKRPTAASCGPTANSCATGIADPSSFVAGLCATTDTWTCRGLSGGADASCSSPSAGCPGPSGPTPYVCDATPKAFWVNASNWGDHGAVAYTPWANICTASPNFNDAPAGAGFAITADLTGSSWGPPWAPTGFFTKGTAKQFDYQSPGTKYTYGAIYYDGNCGVYGSAKKGGNPSAQKAYAISLNSVTMTCGTCANGASDYPTCTPPAAFTWHTANNVIICGAIPKCSSIGAVVGGSCATYDDRCFLTSCPHGMGQQLRCR